MRITPKHELPGAQTQNIARSKCQGTHTTPNKPMHHPKRGGVTPKDPGNDVRKQPAGQWKTRTHQKPNTTDKPRDIQNGQEKSMKKSTKELKEQSKKESTKREQKHCPNPKRIVNQRKQAQLQGIRTYIK